MPDSPLPFIHEIACDGLRFPFWIANQHAKRWWHKPEMPFHGELQAQKAMCREGGVVLDVGAHHGLNTLFFARWVGETGQVHAFEANAENALVLSANVGLNRLRHCFCVHAAVGGQSGVIHFDGEQVSPRDGGRTVPLIALDEYCGSRGLGHVDVLKIDVEGYEGEVLRGAGQVLASRPRIDLELHLDDLARFGHNPAEVLAPIDLSRYRVTMLVRPDWVTVRPLSSLGDLPKCGVANLFFWPAD